MKKHGIKGDYPKWAQQHRGGRIGGVIVIWSSLKTSEIGLFGLNCHFFLNTFFLFIFSFLIYFFSLQQKIVE